MYIQGIDKRIFKDFKDSYLSELYKAYPGKSIKLKIKNDLKETKNYLNIKLLSNLNINYWLIRGWSIEEANSKIKELKSKRKKSKTCLQTEFWMNKGFSEEEAKNKIKNIQSQNNKKFNKKRKESPEKYKTSSPMKTEFWVNKGLSEEEAKSKIKSFRKLNKQFWINRGFTKEDAIKKISDFQKNNVEKFNKKRKEFPEKYNGYLPTQLNYWIKKTKNIEEAKQKLKEHQTTFSLEICVEKYGEIDGYKIWKERQKKWKEKVFNGETYIGQGQSILSNNIINEILKLDSSHFLYGKTEKFIYDSKYKRAYKYDLTKSTNKKIIEINGTFWHCKPSLYESTYKHKIRSLTAKEIWDFDKRKRELAKEKGYSILTIWEDEYYENPEMIINKCINFLK